MGKRTQLVIRCTGRAFNRFKSKPVGRVCGAVFGSAAAYRDAADWIERARSIGWRVSPLQPGNTVTAICPNCVGRPKT